MRALHDTTELEGCGETKARNGCGETEARNGCGETEARNGEGGQGLVEYAMILMVVAIVVVGVLTALGTSVDGMLQGVGSVFP